MTVLLAVLIAVIPWLEGGGGAAGLLLAHSLILCAAGVSLRRAARRGALEVAAGWETAAAGLVVLVAFLSFLGVDYRFGSLMSLWNAAATLLLGITLLTAAPVKRRVLATVVSAATAAVALHVLFSAAEANRTVSGTFANANQMAAYLTFGMLVAAGLCAEALGRRAGGDDQAGAGPPRAVAAVTGLTAALGMAALLKVGSRGALLSLLCAAIVWVAAAGGLPRGRAARAALAGGLLLLVALAGFSVARRFERIEDPYRFDRPRIWQAGMRAAADHPVLGLGPGMFERRGYRYNFPLEREQFRYAKVAGSAHSTWVQAAAELGFGGLAAVAAAAFLLGLAAWRVARRGTGGDRGAALGLIALLVQACFDMPFEVPAVSLTVIALLVPALRPSVRDAPLACVWRIDPSVRAHRGGMAAALLLIALLEAGFVLRPFAAHVTFARGLERSRPGEPDASLSRAISLEASNPLYPATRAELLTGRPAPLDPPALAQAHRDLDTAHRLDPGNPAYLLALAHLHARACADMGCDAAGLLRTEAYYEMAIALGRKDPRPLAELAALRASLGRGDEAEPLLRQAVGLEPRFAEGWLGLARTRLQRGDRAGAAEALRELERVRETLKGYVAKNRYEQDLMRLDLRRVEEVRRALEPA